MYNRINKLFEQKKENILTIYFTAGYPELNDTQFILTELDKSGANMVEIGIPFSDPTADGPVIQQSSHQALENGMNLELLFEQVKVLTKKVSVPILLMGYFNPVLQYGVERFCKKCKETGIDGVILPDMPLNEYQTNFQGYFEENNLHNILLITPQTSNERIRQIDANSTGFIYMVSSSSTTGENKKVEDFQTSYFEKIKNMQLNNPTLIGFGISDNATFSNACKYANGAIIGSAFIKALQNKELPMEKVISGYIDGVLAKSELKS